MKTTVTAADAKTHFSRLLRHVEAGETIAISKRDETVAFLIPRARLEALVETMEVLGNAATMKAIRQHEAGKLSFRKGVDDGMVAGRPTQPALAAQTISEATSLRRTASLPSSSPGGPSPTAAGFPCEVRRRLAFRGVPHGISTAKPIATNPTSVTTATAPNARFRLRTALPELPVGATEPLLPGCRD